MPGACPRRGRDAVLLQRAARALLAALYGSGGFKTLAAYKHDALGLALFAQLFPQLLQMPNPSV